MLKTSKSFFSQSMINTKTYSTKNRSLSMGSYVQIIRSILWRYLPLLKGSWTWTPPRICKSSKADLKVATRCLEVEIIRRLLTLSGLLLLRRTPPFSKTASKTQWLSLAKKEETNLITMKRIWKCSKIWTLNISITPPFWYILSMPKMLKPSWSK